MRIIGGLNRGRSLQMPKGSQTRPTAGRLRQALFNICQHFIEEIRVLDLFAGSGAVGFEALSRGAAFATFVESNKEAFNCIKKNASHLQVDEHCQILHGDVFAMLKKLEREHASYGMIYADPPYGKSRQDGSTNLLFSTEVILWLDTHHLLEPGGSLFVEEDLRYTPQPTLLTTLQLHDSRRFGQSILQHYIYTN
jgi:16S rRNA (guanine(966)-N(2))-methyltransferase RsmD